MDYTQIGKNIDYYRKKKGFTIDELERRVGISKNTAYTHLRTGCTSLKTILCYAEVLGCSVDDLVNGTLDPEAVDLSADITDRYPYNLALEVMTTPFSKPSDSDMNRLWRVYIPGLLEQLETLTVREKDILEMRYKHGMTLEQCGNKFGATRERIRQIEAKAIRQLRHPMHSRYFIFDTADKALEIAKERDELKLEIIKLREKLKPFMELVNDEPEPVDIHIEDMELSVRAYNCLTRAGYYHLSDFKGKTMSDLRKVRNLGRKSLMEIVDRLKEYGLELDDE